jgi:hypothetical protein
MMSMTRGNFAIAAAFAAAALVYVTLFYYRAPYFDHWDLAPMLEAAEQGRLTPAQLFEVHGGHWHSSAYMLLIALAQFTHWSHLAESLLSLAFVGSACLLTLSLAARFRANAAPTAAPAYFVAATAFLCFSLDQSANLLWGFQLSVFVSQFGAILALWALLAPSIGPARLAAALLGLGIAVTSYATGFALMPLGFALFLLRAELNAASRIAYAAVWASVSAMLCAGFILAQHAAPYGGSFDIADLAQPDFPIYLALFELNFLGAGIARFTTDLMIPVALVGLAACGVCTIHLLRRNVPLSALVIPLSLCAFGLGAGLLCGLGRYDFGAGQGANARYITFAGVFWLGAAWLMLAALAETETRTVRRALLALVCVLALLKIGNSVQSAVKHATLSSDIGVIAETMRANPDGAAAAARRIARARQDIETHVAFMREKSWGVFRGSPRFRPPPPPRAALLQDAAAPSSGHPP